MRLKTVIKSKKAGLQVSINAIVILIFAITILSLGIVFIKNMFSKVSGQFEDVTQQTRDALIEKLRSSSERLALNVEDITLKPGEEKNIYFALKNELDDKHTFSIFGSGNIDNTGEWDGADSVVKCYDSTSESADLAKIEFLTAKKRTLEPGDIKVLKLIIKVKPDTTVASYSCAMIIKDPSQDKVYARKDFYITIE